MSCRNSVCFGLFLLPNAKKKKIQHFVELHKRSDSWVTILRNVFSLLDSTMLEYKYFDGFLLIPIALYYTGL